MRQLLCYALVGLMLTPIVGAAQDIDAGLAAHKAGDYSSALQELEPLAEQGHARAQAMLGYIYLLGTGVTRDLSVSAKWYRLAAEQGHVSAQFSLGESFRTGMGVPQDFSTAHMWFNIAAANGHQHATLMRGLAELHLTKADITEAQRRARVCMASDYQDCD